MFHKRLLKEFECNKKHVVGMVVAQWVSLLANIVLLGMTAWFVNRIYVADVGKEEIIKYSLVLCGSLIVRGGMNVIGNRLSFKASAVVKTRIRELVYSKLMQLGASYSDTITTSEAVQISTEGVEQLEIYFGRYIPQFFYSLLAPLTLFCIVGTMSLKVASILLICVPLIPLSIVAVQKFAKKMLNKYWGTYTELGDSFLENLQGLTTLKIYQADERYSVKMDEEAEKFRKVTMRVLIMQLNSISLMDLIAYGGAAFGILVSIAEYQKGIIGLSQCFFIIMVSAEFFLPLRLLGSFFHIAMNGNAAADKIFRLLDVEVKEKGTISEVKGSNIVFDHITFGYGEDKDAVLNDISFEIKEHEMTALVGTSGCGKSTIASIVMGVHDNYQGKIHLGNVEHQYISEEAIYQKVTRIKHDSYLFKGTVEDNLRMGNANSTQEEMYSVLKQVDLLDMVIDKGGLTMELTEKASNLSGGQKQRLALARALLHDTDLYIFDEATSNIDVESENKIMDVIRELAKKKTVLLISHRLANVVEADTILVMKQGSIMESGSHESLLEQKGYYSELYERQMELECYARGYTNG